MPNGEQKAETDRKRKVKKKNKNTKHNISNIHLRQSYLDKQKKKTKQMNEPKRHQLYQ